MRAGHQSRVRIARHRDAGDVRAVHPVAGKPQLFERRLVLVGLQRRQVLLHFARFGTVDVRLEVREALEPRFHPRNAALQFGRNRLQARRSRAWHKRSNAITAGSLPSLTSRSPKSAVSTPPSHTATFTVERGLPGASVDVARRPDVGLVDLVRGEIARVRVDQRRLQRQRRRQPVLRVDERRREIGAERAGLVDGGLDDGARVAQDQRLAGDLRAGLRFLHFVLHDVVRHLREVGIDQPPGLGAVCIRRAIADLALRRDHRAQLQPRHQLVGRLVLQLLDARRAFQRRIVVAFEEIELRQLAFDAGAASRDRRSGSRSARTPRRAGRRRRSAGTSRRRG